MNQSLEAVISSAGSDAEQDIRKNRVWAAFSYFGTAFGIASIVSWVSGIDFYFSNPTHGILLFFGIHFMLLGGVFLLVGVVSWYVCLLAGPKESKFARFHLNQGLVLMILGTSISFGAWFIFRIVIQDSSSIPYRVSIFVFPAVALGLAVLGVMNAVRGKLVALPAIGGWQILINDTKTHRLLPVEPKRPVFAWVVLLLSFTAIGCFFTSLITSYLDAVSSYNPTDGQWITISDSFNKATWFTALIPTEFGSPWRILLVVAITVIGLLPSISAAISGFYAFAGYRWARIVAIISFVLSGASVLLNGWAYPATALTFIAAIFAWLPPMRRYFAAWRAIRHPEPNFAEAASTVYYGPLPKYLPAPVKTTHG